MSYRGTECRDKNWSTVDDYSE